MKKVCMGLILFAALGACNTIEGFGEDVSEGARAVNRAF